MPSKKKNIIGRKPSTPHARANQTLSKKKHIASNEPLVPRAHATLKSKKVKTSREAVLQTTPLAFSRFPPEIRENIFARCIDIISDYQPQITDLDGGRPQDTYISLSPNENNPHSPSLIIALRGHPMFYAEALRCYYRLNTFFISQQSMKTWISMKGSQEVLGMMKQIAIV